jgi:hypothetical protein
MKIIFVKTAFIKSSQKYVLHIVADDSKTPLCGHPGDPQSPAATRGHKVLQCHICEDLFQEREKKDAADSAKRRQLIKTYMLILLRESKAKSDGR